MRIAVVAYDRFTPLDAIGPAAVLAELPGAELTWVAERPGPVRTEHAGLAFDVRTGLDELTDPDLILVPGGPGQVQLMTPGHPLHDWLRAASWAATWTASVCTGSLVLGAAGLLTGRKATTHWLALDQLPGLGAVPVAERVVFDGQLVTAAGVSAGIDLALQLAAIIAGETVAQTIQLAIEYDPQPPFDAGSPRTAPPALVEALRARPELVLTGLR